MFICNCLGWLSSWCLALLFSKWFWIYFAIQSIFMIYLWNQIWKILMQIKEKQVKEGFEEFYRTDVHLWNYNKLLFGFIFLVPFRTIGLILNMFISFAVFVPLMYFHQGDTLGRKMKIVAWILDKTCWRLMLFFLWIRVD